jgi:hypothetical protein
MPMQGGIEAEDYWIQKMEWVEQVGVGEVVDPLDTAEMEEGYYAFRMYCDECGGSGAVD